MPVKRTEEVWTVDEDTGGEKGCKDEAFDLIPPPALWALAQHYGVGSKKYAKHNWARGYAWSKSYAAAQRHLNLFWMGEDVDEETGSLHVVAALWHLMSIATFQLEALGTDDRHRYVGVAQ